MTAGRDQRNADLLGRFLGSLLILLGSAFIVVAVIITTSNENYISEYVGLPIALFGFGGFLIWVGYRFVWSERNRTPGTGHPQFHRWLVTYRRVLGFVAAIGSVLMMIRVVSICIGRNWPSGTALCVVAASAIALGVLTRSILVPFNSGLFPMEVWDRWSPAIQFMVAAILNVDWLGYLAVFVILFDLDRKINGEWRFAADALVSLLISLLYTSQFVALCFGNVRALGPQDNA